MKNIQTASEAEVFKSKKIKTTVLLEIQERIAGEIYEQKRFTVTDLWNIHRQRRNFSRRRSISLN